MLAYASPRDAAPEASRARRVLEALPDPCQRDGGLGGRRSPARPLPCRRLPQRRGNDWRYSDDAVGRTARPRGPRVEGSGAPEERRGEHGAPVRRALPLTVADAAGRGGCSIVRSPRGRPRRVDPGVGYWQQIVVCPVGVAVPCGLPPFGVHIAPSGSGHRGELRVVRVRRRDAIRHARERHRVADAGAAVGVG